MTIDSVTNYREQAMEFLARARSYLADGDLHQASEKGWGAASHMVKAVAAAMGRQYNRHEVFRQIIRQVASRTGNRRRLVKLSHSAEMLHSNYYQRKMFLDAGDIADDLNDVAELLDRLTPLISATTRN